MKLSRIIWILLVGLFVYWGATTDTLANLLNGLAERLEPTAEVVDQATNRAIDTLNESDDLQTMRLFNRVLLGLSCLAFVLSIIYRFLLKESAKRRNTFDEIDFYMILSALSILLTLFNHDEANWWSLLLIPICCFMVVYPLLYIPYYRYLKWISSTIYDILVLIIGGVYFSACLSEGSLFARILSGIFGLLAIWIYYSHRKSYSCPSCKRYVEVLQLDHHIDRTDVEYRDREEDVATGYRVTERIDKHGNRSVVSKVATGWKRIFYTQKRVRKHYTDHFQCPYCGYKYVEQGVEESEKNLGYKEREERAGSHRGDIDKPNN